MIRYLSLYFVGLGLLALAACSTQTAAPQDRAQNTAPKVLAADPPAISAIADQKEVADLARLLVSLSPDVSAEEAARAASISYAYTAQLKQEYQITDPPLVHNFKVNRGIKPRGLCWHWAEDMEKRLKAERFETLEIHRAIANHDNVRIDHSTAIMSAKGTTMFDGVVVDPWRKGGTLTWVAVGEDRRYKWRPQAEVLQFYRERDRL